MEWLKANWKRIAKYAGLGVGCVAVGVLAFVGARYVSSGSEYEGALLDLVPADAAIVIRIDSVPKRKYELERLIDHALLQPGLVQLESSSMWQDSMGENIEGGLYQFKQDKWDAGLAKAQADAEPLGARLFEDVLGGELVLATDPGPDATEFVALSRVARGLRFKWAFMDLASGFFPEGPNQPKLEYNGGVLYVTPQPTEQAPAPVPMLITLLDDVLVVSNSQRMLNESVRLHSEKGRGMSGRADYVETLKLVSDEQREKHVAGIWLDLDRLRKRMPGKEQPDGTVVSPIDRFNAMPKEVEGIYPDIFAPVNRILKHDLDSRPFHAAYYGLDVSEPSALMFDQYLLVSQDRVAQDRYAYLRKTWAQAPAEETQLKLLPPDTMIQVSYRQPLEVLYNDVFDETARASLVGDFIVALRGPSVKAQLSGDIQGLAFAAAPRSYAPGSSIPLSGAEFPLPAFSLMFRAPGAQPEAARALLDEYLAAQRGRARKPGEAAPTGVVTVVEKPINGRMAYGFLDPREDDNFIRRLNREIRAALVGEWLILTNSEQMLSYAFGAQDGGLAGQPGSAWRLLPGTGSATAYLNFDQFAAYAGGPELAKVLRDNKYNTGLIEGRDPGEVRREIAAQVGTEDVSHPEVTRIYNERKGEWLRVCMVEGNRYESEFRGDMGGLRFFKDLALITTFADDHLHVQGVLRIGN